jgi:hypothetical protein
MESAGCCDAMAERSARSRRAAERSEAELRRRGEGVYSGWRWCLCHSASVLSLTHGDWGHISLWGLVVSVPWACLGFLECQLNHAIGP